MEKQNRDEWCKKNLSPDLKVVRCQWCKFEGAAEFNGKAPNRTRIQCPQCDQWLQPGEYDILYDATEKKGEGRLVTPEQAREVVDRLEAMMGKKEVGTVAAVSAEADEECPF